MSGKLTDPSETMKTKTPQEESQGLVSPDVKEMLKSLRCSGDSLGVVEGLGTGTGNT